MKLLRSVSTSSDSCSTKTNCTCPLCNHKHRDDCSSSYFSYPTCKTENSKKKDSNSIPQTGKYHFISKYALSSSSTPSKTVSSSNSNDTANDEMTSFIQKREVRILRKAFAALYQYNGQSRIYRKNKKYAITFYRHVLMLRFFFSWAQYTFSKRSSYRQSFNIVRKIFLLWRELAIKGADHSKALQKLRFVKYHYQRRIMMWKIWQNWLSLMNHHTIIQTFFQKWVDWYDEEMYFWKTRRKRKIKKRFLNAWFIDVFQWNRCSKYYICQLQKKFFCVWKEATIKRVKRKKIRKDKMKKWKTFRKTHLVLNVFKQWRKKTNRIRLYQTFITSFSHTIQCCLIRLFFLKWTQIQAVDVSLHKIISVISKSHAQSLYCCLDHWKKKYHQMRKKERIVLIIIFNRWAGYTDEMKDQKYKTNVALRHWAANLCLQSIQEWQWFVQLKKNKRLGANNLNHNRNYEIDCDDFTFAEGGKKIEVPKPNPTLTSLEMNPITIKFQKDHNFMPELSANKSWSMREENIVNMTSRDLFLETDIKIPQWHYESMFSSFHCTSPLKCHKSKDTSNILSTPRKLFPQMNISSNDSSFETLQNDFPEKKRHPKQDLFSEKISTSNMVHFGNQDNLLESTKHFDVFNENFASTNNTTKQCRQSNCPRPSEEFQNEYDKPNQAKDHNFYEYLRNCELKSMTLANRFNEINDNNFSRNLNRDNNLSFWKETIALDSPGQKWDIDLNKHMKIPSIESNQNGFYDGIKISKNNEISKTTTKNSLPISDSCKTRQDQDLIHTNVKREPLDESNKTFNKTLCPLYVESKKNDGLLKSLSNRFEGVQEPNSSKNDDNKVFNTSNIHNKLRLQANLHSEDASISNESSSTIYQKEAEKKLYILNYELHKILKEKKIAEQKHKNRDEWKKKNHSKLLKISNLITEMKSDVFLSRN